MDDGQLPVAGVDAAQAEDRVTGFSGRDFVDDARRDHGLAAHLLGTDAADGVVVSHHAQVGEGLLARRLRVGTAGREEAAVRTAARRRRPAGNADERPAPGEMRDGSDQPACVGMCGGHEELLRRAELDDPAGVHHRHARCQRPDDGQVVAHVERGRAVERRQLAHRPEHVRLRRHVEAGGRLVEHDHPRPAGERHREADALLLAARELVRVPAQVGGRVGQRHLAHHLGDPLAPLTLAGAERVRLQHLHELRADPKRWVQRRGRVLRDV